MSFAYVYAKTPRSVGASMRHVQNVAHTHKEQAFPGFDKKYDTDDLPWLVHGTQSTLFKSDVNTALRDLHPGTGCDIYSGATVVIDVM